MYVYTMYMYVHVVYMYMYVYLHVLLYNGNIWRRFIFGVLAVLY